MATQEDKRAAAAMLLAVVSIGAAMVGLNFAIAEAPTVVRRVRRRYRRAR